MKKHFFLLSCILLSVSFASYAQIQPAVHTEKMDNTEEYYAKNAIDLVVMAKFNKNYIDASNESWLKTPNGYKVDFTKDGIKHSVFLNKKGRMTSQISQLTEKNLPANVRNLIKSLSGCFTIGHCREVTTEMGKAYLITVDYDTTWKVMRVVGDEMDVYEEYKKG
jgi:hypothetical protein